MATLELATLNELEICCNLMIEGKNFQREQGFIQWKDDYPSLGTITNDIQHKKGHVVKIDGNIAGYMCISFGEDPAYDEIRGAWHTSKPYAVVHRMALGRKFRNIGLSGTVFNLIEELCLSKNIKNIRMDTDFQNKRMRHVLEKNGFAQCGIVTFNGDDKLAYDKILFPIKSQRPHI